ncbi:MAG: hypothetical protein H6831_08765 [Planctomycetes bacterium]|nr:hypothetical protein [Planctomycetota bacterium]
MTTFLDKAHSLAASGQVSQDEAKSIRAVFKALHSLDPVFAKASIDSRNVEALFSAVSMGTLLERFGSASPAEISTLEADLNTLVAATVEASMPMRRHQADEPWLHVGYVELWRWATSLRTESGPKPTFITFNYDVALDQALVGASSCLDTAWSPNNLNLLKLHGSLAWRSCGECGLTFDTFEPQGDQPLQSNRRNTSYRSAQVECPHCKDRAELCKKPVIVPPTWNKLAHHAQLANVWRAASDALRAAQQIIVSGYSLPPSDEFFTYLYALGVEGDARLTRFTVYDPDTEGVANRFRELLGEAVRDRFDAHGSQFHKAMERERQHWRSRKVLDDGPAPIY